MSDAVPVTKCFRCGAILNNVEIERELGECRSCRSRDGKIAQLDLAIRTWNLKRGEYPNEDLTKGPHRIPEWPTIRHLLRQCFDPDDKRSEVELWQRCTDWLSSIAEPKLYLVWPFAKLIQLLIARNSETQRKIEKKVSAAIEVTIEYYTTKGTAAERKLALLPKIRATGYSSFESVKVIAAKYGVTKKSLQVDSGKSKKK